LDYYLISNKNSFKNFTSATNGTNNLNKAIQIKNSIKSSIKKFEDLKIPIEQPNKNETKTDNLIISCKSKSKEVLSERDNDEIDEKEEKKLNLLKIAPIINLDEFEFLGASSLAIETENGLYHRKDNANDLVSQFLFS